MPQEPLTSGSEGIRIDESVDGGVVISALQVVEPGFSGVAVAELVFIEILYHISAPVARRNLVSARQIRCRHFGHCAEFPGGCFVPSVLSVSPGNAKIRAEHRCPARMGRENLFRGLLFCDCCGHPLPLSRKKLKDREVDIYLCTHHNRRPDECPKTHIIYHEVLYPYILEQIRALARSMKRRKVNSPICRYADIQELTPEILSELVERILVAHVQHKAKTAKVIEIYWRLS